LSQRASDHDFEAHVLFSFARIPEEPGLRRRFARIRRWFTIAFVESWLAVWLYRAKVRLRARAVPVAPAICDMISRALFRVQIGNRVEIGPGLMLTHGNVVIDGRTRIGRNCQINPWVTVGLSNSRKLGFSLEGPRIGDNVHIGTGAKVLGPITIGDHVRIGANAVVVSDVPSNTTVVGAPARALPGRRRMMDLPAEVWNRDERLAAHLRGQIADYRLGRQSIDSLMDAMAWGFAMGSFALRQIQRDVDEPLLFLEAVVASGGDHSTAVDSALDEIDSALRRLLEQYAA
jgi:serine O-acetyltransferase